MASSHVYTSADGKDWEITHNVKDRQWVARCGDLEVKVSDQEGRMGLILKIKREYSLPVE